MTDLPTPHIVILGGGTAGWMAACLLAHRWPAATITLVESPAIGIVGVGEGSTPQLRQFFATLGIAESEWMPRCHATYKTGIAFAGWSERPGYARYFHPFASAIDLHTEPLFHRAHQLRRTRHEVPAHPDAFFLNSWLAQHSRAPLAGEGFPFEVGYGYHFDAHLVGAFLREYATGRGVVHLPREVCEVAVNAVGDVAALVLDGGDRIEADLFVDSSGFRSVIAQAALGVPFRSFGDNLFNDRAVMMPTPLSDGPLPAHTTATALSSGWAWHIPLTARIGNGYVYSSRYLDRDAAEGELRVHLGVGEAGTARHLDMKVGRVETTWTANCLTIGLAQGFIEPLEATALHIVQATVEHFAAAWEQGGFTPKFRPSFNTRIAARYEGVRDYIVAHYRVNRRTDTAYWRDNAANDALSDSLKRVLHTWFTGGDLSVEIAAQDIGRYYAPLSWGCLLAGYGTFPDDTALTPADDPVDRAWLADFLARCGSNFADHRAVVTNGGQA